MWRLSNARKLVILCTHASRGGCGAEFGGSSRKLAGSRQDRDKFSGRRGDRVVAHPARRRVGAALVAAVRGPPAGWPSLLRGLLARCSSERARARRRRRCEIADDIRQRGGHGRSSRGSARRTRGSAVTPGSSMTSMTISPSASPRPPAGTSRRIEVEVARMAELEDTREPSEGVNAGVTSRHEGVVDLTGAAVARGRRLFRPERRGGGPGPGR